MHETHEAFIKWAHTYEHTQVNGISLNSQKNFLRQLGIEPMIIEENFSESQIFKMSEKYLNKKNY